MMVADSVPVFLDARRGLVRETTRARDGQILRNLPADVLAMDLADVTPDRLTRVVMGWDGARGTRERVRISLMAWGKWLAGEGFVEVSPAAGLPHPVTGAPARSPYPWEWADVPVLVARVRQAAPVYAPLVSVAAHTGLRWGELVALRVESVRLDDRAPHLIVSASQSQGFQESGTKSGGARLVPCDSVARRELRPLIDERPPSARVFTTPRGMKLDRPGFTRAVHWDTVAPGHHFHDLRHTCAVHWAGIPGVTTSDVRRWLGHASLSTTERYLSGLAPSARDAVLLQALDSAAI